MITRRHFLQKTANTSIKGLVNAHLGTNVFIVTRFLMVEFVMLGRRPVRDVQLEGLIMLRLKFFRYLLEFVLCFIWRIFVASYLVGLLGWERESVAVSSGRFRRSGRFFFRFRWVRLVWLRSVYKLDSLIVWFHFNVSIQFCIYGFKLLKWRKLSKQKSLFLLIISCK